MMRRFSYSYGEEYDDEAPNQYEKTRNKAYLNLIPLLVIMGINHMFSMPWCQIWFRHQMFYLPF
ncbi:hypothetical protein HanRHA438_Chr11g0528221 [Helianthus annuus]|nr:hypothetical protein HanRHA438_Chr11g0528221 [Helianthus annuus]